MNNLQKLSIFNIRTQWQCNFYKSNIYSKMKMEDSCNSSKNKRLLYNSTSLGLDSFIEKRQKFQRESSTNWNIYKQKLKESCAQENSIMIFTNDVTRMIYHAENKEDLDLIHKLLEKLKSQTFVKVHSYYSGVEVMKLHYIMNRPLEAKQLVENPLLYSEFQSPASYVVFLDLLYKNNLFEEVIKMYNYRLNQSKFSYFAPLHVIYFAACYKLNTKESFDNAFKVWQILLKYQYKPGLRIRLFFATLALNQNQFFCAMEVLPMSVFSGLSENLKCIILAKTKRYEDVLENLKKILTIEKKDFFILKETIATIEKEICSYEKYNKEFQCIKEDLVNMNKVKDETLDAYLCADVELKYVSQKASSFPQRNNNTL